MLLQLQKYYYLMYNECGIFEAQKKTNEKFIITCGMFVCSFACDLGKKSSTHSGKKLVLVF